jgi:hypothetical protein
MKNTSCQYDKGRINFVIGTALLELRCWNCVVGTALLIFPSLTFSYLLLPSLTYHKSIRRRHSYEAHYVQRAYVT